MWDIQTPSPEKEAENVRRQQFLNKNGVGVEINGSWGPWQEAQYEKVKAEVKGNKLQCYLGLMILLISFVGTFLCISEPRETKGTFIPILLGLTTIAGAYLVKDNLRCLFTESK